eukprot:scaffold17342_cov130-Isochrysis_galbana.AAC.2
MYTHCSTHATSRIPQATSMQLYVKTQEWGYFATLACRGAGSSTRGRDRLLRDELFTSIEAMRDAAISHQAAVAVCRLAGRLKHAATAHCAGN